MDIDITKIIKAAEAGGKGIARYFGEVLEIEEKSSAADFRTKADLGSEKEIIKNLQKYFPDFGIYSEETGDINKKSEYKFIIDPLDGTNNFVLGIPQFSVSIGLLKGDKIIAGVIHHPITQKTFWAKVHEGAFIDGHKIHINEENDFQRSTISFSCGYLTENSDIIRITTNLNNKNPKRILDIWSPAIEFCLLASGKIEGIVMYGAETYDFSAGKLIAKEAGAKVTTLKGEEDVDDLNNFFIISNGTSIHSELIEVV